MRVCGVNAGREEEDAEPEEDEEREEAREGVLAARELELEGKTYCADIVNVGASACFPSANESREAGSAVEVATQRDGMTRSAWIRCGAYTRQD